MSLHAAHRQYAGQSKNKLVGKKHFSRLAEPKPYVSVYADMSADKYPELFVFVAGEDWEMNACLNFMHDMSHGYIEGYLLAADRLVQHVAETGLDQDYFVYPIAFMYRQHVELQLKLIISTGRKLLTVTGGHPKHHKLHNLWQLAKAILRQTWPNAPEPPEFKKIDNFIDQFSEIDHDSTAFRYPRQKAGNPSLDGIRHINLRNLAECVHSFSDFLDGAASGLIDYLDDVYQCERDMNHC